MLKNESAFKQESILLIAMLMTILTIDISLYEKLMLLCAVLFLMFAEIVNTAIEVTIDRIGLELHPMSGLAKDLGSAAVMIAIIIFFIVCSTCLYINIF